MTDIGHINPTSCNIRRHQHPEGAPSKTFQSSTSLRQTPVAMQHRDSMARTI
jgi:hypothetical protein